jgi:hypothetical protein
MPSRRPRAWVNDGDLAGLATEKDPLIGGQRRHRHLHHPRKPFRRQVKGLPRFVATRAGEYCFIPGIRALQWIAEGQRGSGTNPTKSDPVRPQEDAGFLPGLDAADRARC